jgi:hypothetical protein
MEAVLSGIELHLIIKRHAHTGFANILPTIMWNVRWSQIIEKTKRSTNILPGVLSYIAALVNWLLFIHSHTENYPENHCPVNSYGTSVSQMTTCSVCGNNNPVVSSYMSYTWIPPSITRQVPNVVEKLLNLPHYPRLHTLLS